MSKNNPQLYISCIKIDGTPILPPVITPELRKELIKYKRQAVKLEQHLKCCREFKEHLNDLLTNIPERPPSELTFGDNSHIEALNICDNFQSGIKYKKSNLNDNIDDKTNVSELCDSGNTHQTGNVNTEQSAKGDDNLITFTPPKPRLIRSNSYTLESPSPILLAHLQKVKQSKQTEFSARNWISFENNQASCDSSDFESINTVCYKPSNTHFNTEESPKNINEIKSPTIEVYQTDISVQQITLNNCIGDTSKEEKRELFFNKDPFDTFEPNSELTKILSEVPEAAAKQILELLKKQHSEQKERLERYDNFNMSSSNSSNCNGAIQPESDINQIKSDSLQLPVPQLRNVSSDIFLTPNDSTKSERPNSEVKSNSQNFTSSTSRDPQEPRSTHASEKLTRSSTFSMSPSQSLYYSVTSSADTLTAPSTPSIKLIDLENEAHGNIEIGVLKEKNGYWEGLIVHDSPKNCSKELFPEIDPVTMEYLRKEWAASVIGAHVRGYLTRRLLQTEKVQSLIATVRDVLICALELHRSDNIDEKDVELHRRLINQLSAALYSFHDVFFDLSKPEQMLIIAADRQRKREKLKKSVNDKNSSRSLHSSRSNKSLVLSQTPSKSPSLTKV